jgi:hypothetical protein
VIEKRRRFSFLAYLRELAKAQFASSKRAEHLLIVPVPIALEHFVWIMLEL